MGGVRKAAVAALLLLGTTAFVVPLVYSPLSAHTLLGREIVNFAHAPVFIAIFLLLLRLTTLLGGTRLTSRWAQYLLAAAVALVIGVTTEASQYFSARDADLVDLLRNVAGVTVGMLWTATLDRRLVEQVAVLARPRMQWLFRWGAVLILVFAFMPVVVSVWAYHELTKQLPLLRGFDSPWERRFLDGYHIEVEEVPAPPGWNRGREDLVGQVTFSRVAWPVLAFEECHADWTPYAFLALDLYSESAGTHRMWLTVEDIEYAATDDRFNYKFTLAPGATTIRIPLADVRAGPEGRELELEHIKNVRLHADHPPESFKIWIDDLRLEGAQPESAD